MGASQAGQRWRSGPRIAGTPRAARPRPRGSSAACARTAGRTRPSRRASSDAPPGSSSASPGLRHPRVTVGWGPLAPSLEWPHGSSRSRARRLPPGDEGRRPRPRRPARGVPANADHARDRGARAHPLQAGKDPGLVLHGARERGRRRRRRDGDGEGRRRDAAPPRHGRPRHARGRAVEDLRAVHGPRGRPDARAGRERAHGVARARPASDGQPSAGDAAGRGRHGARVQDSRRPAGRRRLVRRRIGSARRRPRRDELRRRAPAAR